MAAERRSFADLLQPVVFWDASYALALMTDTERFHGECVSFCTAALESGVNAFLTLDQDFQTVDGIIVYTCLLEG